MNGLSQNRAFDEDDLAMFAAAVDRWAVDQAAAAPAEGWRAMAELGLGSLGIGAARGGLGGNMAEIALVMQAIGHAPADQPYWSAIVLAAALVEAADGEGRHDALLAAMVEGRMRVALAHQEPASGPDPDWVETRGRASGADWRLSGAKRFVLDGPGADRLLVSARMDDGALGLFLVRPDAAGVTLTAYPTVDDRPACDLRLDDVALSAADRVGDGDARPALLRAHRRALLGLCAEGVGVIAATLAQTVDYMQSRQQFGVPIISFQALQHRLADLLVAEMEATAITRRAIAAYDGEAADAASLASAAKAYVSQAALAVTQAAVQLHGGMGMTEELAIGRYLKRAQMIATMLGDADWHIGLLDRMDIHGAA